MPAAERTYSFRAPSDLGERLASAQRRWIELSADPTVARWLNRDFAMELARRRRRAPQLPPGAFLRSVAEAFALVTEEVAEALELQRRHRDIEERLGPEPENAQWAEAGSRLMAEAYRRDGDT